MHDSQKQQHDEMLCSYVAKDLDHGKISEEALVHMLVRSPEYWSTIRENSAPVAQSASFEVEIGKNLTARINVTDDYDTMEQLTFSVPQQPSRGTVTVNGPDFTYVPDPRVAWSGKDFFTIKVTNGTANVPVHGGRPVLLF